MAAVSFVESTRVAEFIFDQDTIVQELKEFYEDAIKAHDKTDRVANMFFKWESKELHWWILTKHEEHTTKFQCDKIHQEKKMQRVCDDVVKDFSSTVKNAASFKFRFEASVYGESGNCLQKRVWTFKK